MEHDAQHHPDPEQIADLDQQRAWNLPAAPLVPVGPLQEAWPTTAEIVAEDEPPGDDPAAA
jgi:hypothetical protein